MWISFWKTLLLNEFNEFFSLLTFKLVMPPNGFKNSCKITKVDSYDGCHHLECFDDTDETDKTNEKKSEEFIGFGLLKSKRINCYLLGKCFKQFEMIFVL